MANCQTSDKISNNMMFVSLEKLVLFTEFVAGYNFFLDIFHRPLTLLVIFL